MIYTNSRNIVFYLFDMLYSIKSFPNFCKDINKLLKKKKKNVEYNWNYKPATIGLLIIKLLETWKTYQKKKNIFVALFKYYNVSWRLGSIPIIIFIKLFPYKSFATVNHMFYTCDNDECKFFKLIRLSTYIGRYSII